MRIIFDANNIGYMASYAFGDLSYKDRYTGVIYGFLNQILKMAEKFDTTEFVFCWDSRHRYRSWIYPEYKANRRKTDSIEELGELQIMYNQFTKLRKEVLPKLGFENIFYHNGYEADDLIAEVVARCPGKNIIFSSDGDLWQLLLEERHHFVRVFNAKTKKIFTKKEFMLGWGIEPNQWAMAKAMAGDSSDNIKGIEGVGLLGACKYLKGELTGKKKDKIESEESKEIIHRNLQLIALPYRGPKKIEVNSLGFGRFKEDSFIEVFEEYGFESFFDKFEKWEEIFKLQ